MPIIKNMEVHWVRLDPNQPAKYQDNPYRWNVQIRTADKKVKANLQKEYGFKWNEVEDEDTGETQYWYTSLSRYAYKRDKQTGEEDFDRPNTPVNVILGDGTPVDPNTVGNGSIANLSFNSYENKHGTISKDLVGMQVIKQIVYTPRDDVEPFELTSDFEVVDNSGDEDADGVPF